MRVVTESGSEYNISQTGDSTLIHRKGSADMRGDDLWLECYQFAQPTIGESMVLYLEPLSGFADVTVRRTSRVVSIEED